MSNLSDIERGLRLHGLMTSQVATALRAAQERIAAGRLAQPDRAAPARELHLESPYFWGAFDPLPAQTGEGE